MAYRILVEDLPTLAPGGPWSLWDAPEADSLVEADHVVGLYSLDVDAPPLALGTKAGVVKRVVPEYKGWESWEVASIKDGDEIVGVAHAADSSDLVFITTQAQLLRMSAREVRPQGRPAGGMAGIKLGEDAEALFFTAISKEDRETAIVATLAVGPDAVSTIKTTAFSEYPSKGRATSGVRTHRFLKGQDHLALGWVGLPPLRACSNTGTPRNLPSTADRRDGGGTKVYGPFQAFG
jgi:DNA gyrase subunit A